MQEASEDQDEDNAAKTNQYLNNPPAPAEAAGHGIDPTPLFVLTPPPLFFPRFWGYGSKSIACNDGGCTKESRTVCAHFSGFFYLDIFSCSSSQGGAPSSSPAPPSRSAPSS